MSTVAHPAPNGKLPGAPPPILDSWPQLAAEICYIAARAVLQQGPAPTCAEISTILSWRYAVPWRSRRRFRTAIRRLVRLMAGLAD